MEGMKGMKSKERNNPNVPLRLLKGPSPLHVLPALHGKF